MADTSNKNPKLLPEHVFAFHCHQRLILIAVAEETGLILPIGAWVLREACLQAKSWKDAGLRLGTMAVNGQLHFAQQFVPTISAAVLGSHHSGRDSYICARTLMQYVTAITEDDWYYTFWGLLRAELCNVRGEKKGGMPPS